jgi:hypothetical protein
MGKEKEKEKGKEKGNEIRQEKDVVQFIYQNQDGNVVWNTITRLTMDLLTRNISNFVNEHTQGRAQQQWLFLDWHGVVDTTNVNVRLSNNVKVPICVISFVKRNSRIREVARDEIVNRISTGQIACGCLVFERPKPKPSQMTETQLFGSKAWLINQFTENMNKNARCMFIDDSEDHVQVASINCWPQVNCVLYNVSTDPDLPIFIDFIISKKYS